MQQTIVSGVALWSAWQPDRNLFFNSFFIEAPDGNLLIDPLPLTDGDAEEIERQGGAAWIAVTNRDHERDARAIAARFGAKMVTSEVEAPLCSGAFDRTVADGDDVCGGRVVALDGLKTAGEFALAFPERKALVVGDALWGVPAGALRLVPDEKLADPAVATLSLRRLCRYRPEHLLLGDGACIFGHAHRALWACLETRLDGYVNRINAADLKWEEFDQEPAPFGGSSAEIGYLIGAEKLGYRLARLAPGQDFCPVHWHAAEEELFYVIEGKPSIRTPRGEVQLHPGDFVAFPTRPSGAHRLFNGSNAASVVLMIANNDERDVCYYPDSHKVLVDATALLVRDGPELDYYDGESAPR